MSHKRSDGSVQSDNESACGSPHHDGGSFARMAGFAVPLTGAGMKTTGVIRCDQPRSLDLKPRGGKKLESVPNAVMDEVLARLAPIFE
jgi:mRNA-degrading endonuclease toxin of MazEF toxin-antitoxin module